MGIGSSVPLKEELKRKTSKTSELLQRILGWMLKESNLLDFYALASPTECNKYVIFTAENLDVFFKDISVQPVDKDGKGVLHFRKIDELKQLPTNIDNERKENCYKIAYFFIRILQVFAALALSVMDAEIPASFTALEAEAAKAKNSKYVSSEEFKKIPLFLSKQKQEQAKRRFGFFGGSIAASSRFYIQNQNYSLLNRYLTHDSGTSTFQLIDDGAPTGIRISEDALQRNKYGFLYKGKDALGKDVELVGYLEMRYEPQPDVTKEHFHVKLYKFNVNGKDIPYPTNEHLFQGQVGADPKFNNQTLARFIKNEFSNVLGKPLSGDASNVKTIKDAKDLPRDIEPRFQVPELWKSLGRQPPIKAYCVARALQLLSPEAIYDSSLKQAARTSICNTRFALQDTGSLPKSGQSITTSSNLLTLNLLFFDVLEKTIPSIRNKQEYKDFLNTMRILYEERTERNDKEITNIYSNIGGIVEKTNPTLCAGRQGPLFTKNTKVASELRSYVQQLIDRQIKHTADVVRVLEMLFIIREGEALLLQPNIQEGGMEAVNQVAEVARKLLVGYYADCEKLYRDGVIVAAANKNSFQPA